ncbi:MAG: prolyl oligopeptidase family serine peptidase, partial [Deltaproteobacteria bacterium]|nr:prolyl oligopeptidase family serine peptidase [Deltaproteobacteria bacterium]
LAGGDPIRSAGASLSESDRPGRGTPENGFPGRRPPSPLRSVPQTRTAAWGTVDAEDLLAFADLLAARPEVDPARLCVAGGSYGGYMSLHLAATTERFAVAVMERGLYDWTSCVGSSDFGHAQHRLFAGQWPWEAPEAYLAQSPIRLVRGVTCPTLVVHSEGDLRVGPEQAHRLFAALLQQGVPTALVLFPEESHGLTRTGRLDRRLERLRQIGAWLDRWIG